VRSGRVERAALPKTRAEESRVIAAQKWLTGHHRDMEVPGFYRRGLPALASRSGVLLFVCSMQAFQALHVTVGPSVADGLKRTQRVDGSWPSSSIAVSPLEVHGL
jgi:hypothetical protein